MSVSACLITYNEIDSIKYCLDWLESLTNLTEICIIDSFSDDGTWQEIYTFKNKTKKKYNIKQQEFHSFGEQKNDCMMMATSDWTLLIDADETYSHGMDGLLGDLYKSKYNAFRFMTMLTYPDRRHFVHQNFLPFGLDPHVRLWRTAFCTYRGDCHERLYDIQQRDLHECNDNDILYLNYSIKEYLVAMLHHQLLKSKESLLRKGERWFKLDMFIKSAEQKIQLDKNWWTRIQKAVRVNRHGVCLPIPKEYRDYKE